MSGAAPAPIIALPTAYLARWLVGERAWQAFSQIRRDLMQSTLTEWEAWVRQLPVVEPGWPEVGGGR